MREVRYRPIGTIHSPLKQPSEAPLRSVSAKHIEGTIDILPKYESGLKDLAEFSHAILIYHFHLSRSYSLTVKPYLDTREHGVFATRAPARPNPIGISIVRLRNISGTTIHIEDLDVVDGTPLLDIKPYVPQFDTRRTQRIGWYTEKIGRLYRTKADRRFTS